MRIGIDCDEVLFPLMPSFLAFLEEKYGISMYKKQVTSFNLWEVPAFGFKDREEAVDRVFEFYYSKDFDKILPVKDSVEVVRRLSKDNSLYVVTSRPSEIADRTSKFIDSYFGGLFRDIISTNHFSREGKKVNKSKVLSNLECSLFIDDNYYNTKEAVDTYITSLLFRQPWNEDSQIIPGIIPVIDWMDIFKVYLLLKHHLF